MNLTDKDIAELLDSVSESLMKSSKKGLKKDAMPEEMPVEQAPEAAPAPEMAPEQAPEEMAPESAPEQAPEQAIQSEEDAPLSDEELQQVYSSMDPEELERHFTVIKDVLTAIHGEGGAEAGEVPSDEMAEGDAPEAAMPETMPEEEAMKSEAFIKLKKENEEIKKSIVSLTKAIETLAKPARKAVTSLSKSEEAVESLSKAEISSKLSEITRVAGLTKSERQTINNYLLSGVGQELVEEIIIKSGRK